MPFSDFIKACWPMDEAPGDWTVELGSPTGGRWTLDFGGQYTPGDWTLDLGGATGGRFKLVYGGKTTPGDWKVDLGSPTDGGFKLTFGGFTTPGDWTLDRGGATGGTFVLTFNGETTNGDWSVNRSGATGGHFKLTYGGNTTPGIRQIDLGGATGGRYSLTFGGQTTVSDWVVDLGGATGGSFTLSFGGNTTAPIAQGAAASVVQGALEALVSVGVGQVIVSSASAGKYEAHFTGTLAGSSSPLNGSGASLTGITGSFSVSQGLAYNAGTDVVKKALEDLSSIGAGNVDVTSGGAGILLVKLTGTLDGDARALTGSGANLTGLSGSFSITELGLKHDASASDVQHALAGLASVGSGNVAVSDGAGDLLVHFTGARAGTQGTLSGSSTLTGGTGLAITAIGIAFDADAATITAFLCGLSTVGASNALASDFGSKTLVHFQGARIGTPLPLSGDGTLLSGVSGTFRVLNIGIPYNAVSGTVQAALEALASVGAGNVDVTAASGFLIHWKNARNGDSRDLTGSGAGLVGGTFAITALGIPYDVSAPNLQAAFCGLSSVGAGNAAVTAAGLGIFFIAFQSALAFTYGAITGDGADLTGGTALVLFFGLAFDASAATVQTAMEELSTVGAGNALVTKPSGNTYVVHFRNALEGTSGLLTGGGAQLVGGDFHITGNGVRRDCSGSHDLFPFAPNWLPDEPGPDGLFGIYLNPAQADGKIGKAVALTVPGGEGNFTVPGGGDNIPEALLSANHVDITADDSFFVAGWVYIPSASATFGGDGFWMSIANKSSAGEVEWALEYNHDDHLLPSIHGLGFTVGVPTSAHDPFDGTLLTLDAWHYLFCWYDAGTQTAYRQIDNGTIFSYVTGAGPGTATVGILFGGITDSGNFGFDGRLDNWLFGKGYVPSSGDRTAQWNAGNGLGCCRTRLEIDAFETLTFRDQEQPTDFLRLDDSVQYAKKKSSDPPNGGTGQPGSKKNNQDGFFSDVCDPTDPVVLVCTRTQRTIPDALAAHLAGRTLTLAYCLRLLRRDGATLGFTTHDRDLTFGSPTVTYEALNSFEPTALRQEIGGTVGSADLTGLLRSDRITVSDILSGRYDGAEMTLFLVNWADLSQGFVTMGRGWWGAATLTDGQWRAEYRSLMQRYQQQIVEEASPTCRAPELGDTRCAPGGVFGSGKTLADFQFPATVTAVVDNRNFTCDDAHADKYFSSGRVIGASGDNLGLAREVKRHTKTGGAAVIELQEALPFAVTMGDVLTLEAGCDRRLVTCQHRFSNAINFQGEPFIPGRDLLKLVRSAQIIIPGP